MASHVFVVDASARRHQVKTTPGKYLRDILQEACQKFNKDPDQFGLSDFGRPPKAFDLSLTVRLAGLVNGAKLQLVQSSRSPAVLPIAIQLPESLGGGRVSDRFPSNTSLWLVLRKFEDAVAGDLQKQLNITQRGSPSTDRGSGILVYEQPVVNVMGREFGSFKELQKTLLQMGFNSGNVLLRLSFKSTNTPMEEAMKEISDYFAASAPPAPVVSPTAEKTMPMEGVEETTAAPGAHAAADGNMSSMPNADAENAAAPAESEAAQDPSDDTVMTPPAPSSEAERPHEDSSVIASSSEGPIEPYISSPTTDESSAPPSANRISVYKPSTSTTPSAALTPHNPSDYEPLVEHAQSHQATLARASQNRRLQSDAEIAASEKERQQALESIKTATLRIRFPDQMMIDLTITAAETVTSLHNTVRDMLENPAEPFMLRQTGPRGQPITLEQQQQQQPQQSSGSADERKLIKDLGMGGRVLLTMVWDTAASTQAREAPVLKAAMRDQARELKVRFLENPVEEEGKNKTEGKKAETLSQRKERNKGDVEARMKKFLGFGKK